MPPITPLRSPIRRLAIFLTVPFALFGLLDAVRSLSDRSPAQVHADEYTPGLGHRYVTVMGLPHLEATTGYTIQRYSERGYYGTTEVGPFALVPLNVPERSEGRVMLAEVPLEKGGIPADMLDDYRIEFVGLAGAVPEDLRMVIARYFPPNATLSRVRVRLGPPRVAVSLCYVVFAALLFLHLRWLARLYERSEDAVKGYAQRVSWFFVAIAQPCLLSIVWMRLLRDPEADSIGLTAMGFGLEAFFVSFAFQRRNWLAAMKDDDKATEPEAAEEEEDEQSVARG